MAELIDRQLLNVRQAVRRQTLARADDDSDHDRGTAEWWIEAKAADADGPIDLDHWVPLRILHHHYWIGSSPPWMKFKFNFKDFSGCLLQARRPRRTPIHPGRSATV